MLALDRAPANLRDMLRSRLEISIIGGGSFSDGRACVTTKVPVECGVSDDRARMNQEICGLAVLRDRASRLYRIRKLITPVGRVRSVKNLRDLRIPHGTPKPITGENRR